MIQIARANRMGKAKRGRSSKDGTNEQTDGRVNEGRKERTNESRNGWMDRWMDGPEAPLKLIPA